MVGTLKNLAIVSSYNEECGAAFYSSRLKYHLEKAGFNVDIKRLPISLLRMSHPPMIRRKGDKEIDRIAQELGSYDGVLLQFEPGLYGSSARTSYRRVRKLLAAAKKVVLTVHGFDRGLGIPMTQQVYKGQFKDALASLFTRNRYNEIKRFWDYVAESKHVQVMTFCKADQTILQRFYNVTRIDNFPITYFDQEEIREIRNSVDKPSFLRRYGLDPTKKYFAVCGFLSAYKGHLTAMKALEYLPDDWNLIILGGEHPHALEAEKDIGTYLNQLLTFWHWTDSDAQDTNGIADILVGKLMKNSSLERKSIKEDIFLKSEFKYFLPKSSLKDRVKFVGQVSDDEMARFYTVVDYVVHPYIKTKSGQSGSGPATMALEFGTRALFSNAPVFREMNHYFTNAMSFFNVGNFVELAEALLRYDQMNQGLGGSLELALQTYNPARMVDTYRRLLGGHGGSSAVFDKAASSLETVG